MIINKMYSFKTGRSELITSVTGVVFGLILLLAEPASILGQTSSAVYGSTIVSSSPMLSKSTPDVTPSGHVQTSTTTKPSTTLTPRQSTHTTGHSFKEERTSTKLPVHVSLSSETIRTSSSASAALKSSSLATRISTVAARSSKSGSSTLTDATTTETIYSRVHSTTEPKTSSVTSHSAITTSRPSLSTAETTIESSSQSFASHGFSNTASSSPPETPVTSKSSSSDVSTRQTQGTQSLNPSTTVQQPVSHKINGSGMITSIPPPSVSTSLFTSSTEIALEPDTNAKSQISTSHLTSSSVLSVTDRTFITPTKISSEVLSSAGASVSTLFSSFGTTKLPVKESKSILTESTFIPTTKVLITTDILSTRSGIAPTSTSLISRKSSTNNEPTPTSPIVATTILSSNYPTVTETTESIFPSSTMPVSIMLNSSSGFNPSKAATEQPTTAPTVKPETTTDPCSRLACENGGTCSSSGGVPTCNCNAGYTGRNCSVDIDDCSGNPCQNGGTCTDMVNDFNCSCVRGFKGKTCGTNIDDCLSSPCQHGICHDLVDGYKCNCSAGYTGLTCVTDINECNSSPCRNGGTCQDKVNGFNCTCVQGFSGTMCENNTDECGSNPCQNGGTCQDLVNGYNCTCAMGFNGTTCENDIDECVNSACRNGATCKDGVNNYTCVCAPGWEGVYCGTDMDECSTGGHNCSKFANCTNKNGSFSCDCKSGFTGDGFTCQDIDECLNSSLNNCVNGSCFNLYGKYACVCNDGWEGDHCDTDIDECNITNSCPADADCTNTDGSYSCACKDGYRQEGDKCVYKVLYDVPDNQLAALHVLNEDDSVREVILQQGIRYFGKMYYIAYVSTNGYIALGKHYNARIPPKSSANWPTDPPIIAPLWADVDPSMNGSGVHFNQINIGYQMDGYRFNATCGFEPTFALMVTWKNAPPYPAARTIKSEPGDFQVVIVTNGSHTSIIFNYDRTYFRWVSAPGRYVAVGYSNETEGAGSIQFTSDNFLAAKTGSNIGISGRWMHVIASSIDSNTTVEARCRNNASYRGYKNFISLFGYRFDPCPCTLAQARRDRRFRYESLEDNVHKFHSTFPGKYLSLPAMRRRCNYNVRGILLQGYPGGGYLEIDGLDMTAVYEDCCVLSELCYLFYDMNPSDTCRFYRPPAWAAGWGDPHITTLDGMEYTFNGRGEYVFARAESKTDFLSTSLEVQVRTERWKTDSDEATVFVGLAAKEDVGNITGDIIEILLNRSAQQAEIYINHTFDIAYKGSSTININGTNFVLFNDSQELILIFTSGFSLQISVTDILGIVSSAPKNDSLRVNMSGLLGNNDGNKENDFKTRNGTVLPANSTEEQLWSFGTSWMLQNQSESLFHYTTELGFSYYNNLMIKPKNFITGNKNITEFLINHCNSTVKLKNISDICGENIACKVDMALTCSQQFGIRSKEMQSINLENAKISSNMPPTINGPEDIFLKYGDVPEDTIITIEDDSGPIAKDGVVYNYSIYASIDSSNASAYVIKWNVTRFLDTDPIPYFKLIATDSMNATTEYWPNIYYCDCRRMSICYKTLGEVKYSTTERFHKLTCQCESGWTGEHCESKINPCNQSQNSCYNTSSCTSDGNEAKCGPCPPGLTGDGTKCFDIDECVSGVAVCNQTCENTKGSYKCSCRTGFFLGSDNSSCIDVDECLTGNNSCNSGNNQICFNTEGSYNCRCRPGFVNESNVCKETLSQFVGDLYYTVATSKDQSTTLELFLWNVFNTSEMSLVSITLVPLGKVRKQYRRSPNLKSQRYILNSRNRIKSETAVKIWKQYIAGDTCAGGLCQTFVNEAGLTINADRSKIYEDNEGELCVVENSRCDAVSTKCTSLFGAIVCNCKPGFEKSDGYRDRCEDIDECKTSIPCKGGGTCRNTVGNYTCHCPAGYGYISSACTDLCISSPCLNGGTCIHGDQEDEYICKCDDKWAGQNCERKNEEASRLHTALIAVSASVGGVCFLLLMTLFGVCRRSRKKYDSYLSQRAMSSINGYERSMLQFQDTPYDDDLMGPSTFSIPRPHVGKGQYEMQKAGSEQGSIEEDGAKFDDPAKPKAESTDGTVKGQENPSFLHSEGSLKNEGRRSKNSYEYF